MSEKGLIEQLATEAAGEQVLSLLPFRKLDTMDPTAFLFTLIFMTLTADYCKCLQPSQVQSQTSADANSEFAIRLNEALGTPGSKNTFFSPYSISTAMGMVYAGASGRTANEIARTFNFGSKEEVQRAYENFYSTINAPGKEYSLSTANGMFVQSGFNLLQSYKETLSTYYHAAAKELDFLRQPEPSRLEINRWVEGQTQNMIKDLFQPDTITPDTRLVLANAIYFKGTWKTLFDAKLTKDEAFKISETETLSTRVPMMNVVSKFNIRHNGELDAKVLQLPYAGNDLSMLIFLPNQYDGLPRLLSSLKARHLSTEGMREMKVQVKLPKFKLETEIDLKDVLQRMGIRDLFTTDADLSGIRRERDLLVNEAIHKARVEVDEQGTEAAAATGIGAVAFSSAFVPQFDRFHADHPFLFLIRDESTKLVLFHGIVADPRN